MPHMEIKYETLDRTGYDCPSALPPFQMNELQANVKRARSGAHVRYMDMGDDEQAHRSDSEDEDA
jgi:hypothetical protein